MVSHLTDNDESSVKPYTDSEMYTFFLLQTSMQVSHGIKNTEPSTNGSLWIVLMRLGMPKIHQESIPQELRNMPVIASNHLRTGGLIRSDYVPILFGVELRRKLGGIDQVAEHDSELPTFCIRRRGSRTRCHLRG
jgi:hypothetical protein